MDRFLFSELKNCTLAKARQFLYLTYRSSQCSLGQVIELIESAEAYKIILEIILEKEINLKGEPIAENEKRKELPGKIARLDVCAIGDDDRVYNAEVQKVPICRRVPHAKALHS